MSEFSLSRRLVAEGLEAELIGATLALVLFSWLLKEQKTI